jgi:tRNA pseudouridine55 synthase
VVKSFEGIIKQVPPVFSAIKVCGKEAYKSARKGKPVELEARQVEIKKIDIVHYDWPLLTINAVTGPGVYIRSLGRDIGERLGVGGGYLTYLKRSRVGEYSCNNAVTLDQFQKLFAEENV